MKDLKVQLGEFSTEVDSKNVAIGKIIKILGDLKKSWSETFNTRDA